MAKMTSSSYSTLWRGSTEIKHIVVFGDSISTTGFDVHRKQPSRSNPLGNPPFPGQTSVELDRPNWVGYLTASHNASLIKTVNLASGGATVDTDIIGGMEPFIRSFKDQTDDWISYYVPAGIEYDWKPDDTLFVSFLGTVDIHRVFLDGSADEQISVLEKDVDRYGELLDTLYRNGARNFLVMNTLPLERAPFIETIEPKSLPTLEILVKRLNNNLSLMAAQFRRDHPEATVLLFSTHTLLSQLIDDPCSMKETCGIKDTTSYCKTFMQEDNDDQCEYSIDQSFWLNTLHPSSRVHKALARAVAGHLDRI